MSGSATVELRSTAVHSTRIDHVCGTVGLVRSGSGWLLDAFGLDACPSAGPTPIAPPAPRKQRPRPQERFLPPGQAKQGKGHGKGHGGGGD